MYRSRIIDSVEYELPKVSTRCVLSAVQRESVIELYTNLYPNLSVVIAHTCNSYKSLNYKEKLFGTWTSALSIVMTNTFWGLTAARIGKLYKHTATVDGEMKIHLLAHVSCFKAHPKNQFFGKPVSVWHHDLYEFSGFVPVHLLCLVLINMQRTDYT